MNNQQNSSGGFGNGFLLGVLLGGGVVFLLGTKKGKQLLKVITEEGWERAAELKDEFEGILDEYEEEDLKRQKPFVNHSTDFADTQAEKKENNFEGKTNNKKGSLEVARRFFKGVPKNIKVHTF